MISARVSESIWRATRIRSWVPNIGHNYPSLPRDYIPRAIWTSGQSNAVRRRHSFKIKTVFPGMNFHYKYKTVVRLSYICSGNHYTGEAVFLYWDGRLHSGGSELNVHLSFTPATDFDAGIVGVSSRWSLLGLSSWNHAMGLLPDAQNCGLRVRRECRESFRHRGLAISTHITARTWRTCRAACRDSLLAVYFEVGGGENVPCIPGACATRNFTYLARGSCHVVKPLQLIRISHNRR